MSDGWTVCIDIRKQKYKEKHVYTKTCPHIVKVEKAEKLERQLHIDNLKGILLSDKVRKLQLEGWIYTRVLRPEDKPNFEENWEYQMIGDFNKWGDRVLFRRELLTNPAQDLVDTNSVP